MQNIKREKGKQGCRCGLFTELVGVLGGMDATVLYGMRHLKTVGAQLGAADHLSLWWWLDRRITDACDRMLTDNHTAVTGGFPHASVGWKVHTSEDRLEAGHALVNHLDITVPPGICNIMITAIKGN